MIINVVKRMRLINYNGNDEDDNDDDDERDLNTEAE